RVALPGPGLAHPHIEEDRVPADGARRRPELHAVAEVAVDAVDDRLPVEALILVVAGRGRVDPAPDHPVPVEGVAERRVDLGAGSEPGLAAGAVRPLPEAEDEDRPVLQPARDEPRRVLRLRAVEEEADLVPV